MDDEYMHLATALDRLAESFPRTASGAEIRMLRMMFSRQEATVAAALTAMPEPVESVAGRAGTTIDDTAVVLNELVERGAVWLAEEGPAPRFRLAPFLPGGSDIHLLLTRDPEYARLAEEYLSGGGGALMMAPQPAIHRVVPARAAVKTEWVLPYDDVRAILLGAEAFRVKDCVCRLQAELNGTRSCSFPLGNCLWFASHSHGDGDGDTISRDAALALLDECESVGLVHTMSNATGGAGYVCNCCGCCCHLLRGITDWGVKNSVAQANYCATIDTPACLEGCEICAQRCQVNAIARSPHGVFVVNRQRCIGCGLCATACPTKAARLYRKRDSEIVPPPVDYGTWERARLRSRGLL